MPADIHAQHHKDASKEPNWLRLLAIGTALTAGAIIIAPYVLPLVHIGSPDLAAEVLSNMHGTGLGNGLAGSINGIVNAIPFIGGTLAKGGIVTALTTGAIGIGGTLLGNFMEQRDDGTNAIRWGKVIRTGALLTSALIAMPTVLTGLSVGIVYLCHVGAGIAGLTPVATTLFASKAMTALANTFGSVGSMNLATAGASATTAILPHLFTCGLSIVPACMAFLMGTSDKKPAHEHAPSHMEATTRVSNVNQEKLQAPSTALAAAR